MTQEAQTKRPGQQVFVNGGQHMGRVVKAHRTSTGLIRYFIKWFHPSERQAQRGWFNDSEVS